MSQHPHPSSFGPSPIHENVTSNDSDGPPRRRAFRRSCDRCHTQKLKCLGNSNTNVLHAQCQRCQQAGLRCKYSQRSAKRTLRKSDTSGITQAMPRMSRATSTPVTATTPVTASSSASSSTATTPQTSPPSRRPTNSLVLKEMLPHTSTEAFPFFDTSVDFDYPLSFPNCWPSSGMIGHNTNCNSCGGMSGFEDEFSLSLDTTDALMPASPSSFAFQVEKNTTGQASTTGTQRELSASLLDVSQDLEAILQGMTAEWLEQDIWNYPIGKFLNASSRLLANLKQHARMDANYSMLAGCLQTKNLFIAVHCYILSVKITASLSDLLLSQLIKAQNECKTGTTPMGRYAFGSPSSPLGNDDIGSAETVASLHSNLRISELFSQLNPYMHALSSACVTLHVSLQLLRENETALGIPKEQGVVLSICQVDSVSDAIHTLSYSLLDKDSMLAPAARVLSVLWSYDIGDGKSRSTSALGEPLDMLKHSYREIIHLAAKHNLTSPLNKTH